MTVTVTVTVHVAKLTVTAMVIVSKEGLTQLSGLLNDDSILSKSKGDDHYKVSNILLK